MNAIDTNVLVYAFDLDEKIKGPQALSLIESLVPTDTVLLWQVACELSGVLTRIGPRSKNVPDSKAAVQSVTARFPIALPSTDILTQAWRLREVHQLSWWDALLIAGCVDAGVERLFSEDVQGKPVIESVQIVNPFT